MCSETVKEFYKSLGISLPGVTAWADTVRKAGTVMRDWSKLQPGDIVATGRPGDTPHVGVYTGGNNVFHQSRSRGLRAGNYPDLDFFKSGYYVRPSASSLARTQPGVASGQGRFITDMGDVRMSEANLRDAQKQQQLIEANIGPISQQRKIAEVNTFTESYRLQTKALQDQQQELTLRNELELKGVSPELIDQQIKLNQLTRDRAETLNTLQGALGKNSNEIKLVTEATDKQIAAQIALDTVSSVNVYKTQTKSIQDQLNEFKLRNRLQMEGVRPEIIDQQVELDRETRAYDATLSALRVQLKAINELKNPAAYQEQIDRINKETAAYREQVTAQEDLNKAINDKRYTFKLDESMISGIDGYVTSIGTLNEAVSSLTEKGFGGLQSSIKELVTTGSTDFKTFALNMISDMLDIITQQLVVAQFAQMLRNVLGGVSGASSALGGGFQMPGPEFIPSGGYAFANGGVMTPGGPLRLQTYARGGIADSPQLALFGDGSTPEAYVPLPDGRRIPVAMQGGGEGGGGVSVTINIDASGTKAEGDSDKSAAIGRELSSVIEAKIISMQRPGGPLYSGNS
jgi:lambda family phage tail tape measure protein